MRRSAPTQPLVTAALCAAILGLCPKLAVAQLTGDSAVRLADASKSMVPPSTFGGELGFNGLGGDYFLSLALRLNFDRENWGFGIQAPIRVRIIDNDPENNNDYGGFVRKEDWDEPSDYLKIARYVYIGQWDKKGPFYIRLGELSGLTVGHGTIMHRYFNGIDPNKWRTGLNVAVNVWAFGTEVMVNDLVDPSLVGARVTVKPLVIAFADSSTTAGDDGHGWLADKLVFGASIFADTKAPFELGTEQFLDPETNQMVTRLAYDKHDRPVVSRERALLIFGVDVGYELIDIEFLTVTPYMDLNKMTVVDNGWGWHLGVLWNFHLPLAIDTLQVDLRTEYRRISGDYLSPYFNTIYEIERYQRLDTGGGTSTPKLRSLCGDLDCNGNGQGSRNGVYFDILAGLPNFVFVGGEYIGYSGPNNDGSLRLSLEVPALEVVKFSAFYYRVNVSGVDDLFKLDDKSAIVAQASIPLYAIFSINARWWRVWQATPDRTGFESVDDYSIGVGLSLEL